MHRPPPAIILSPEDNSLPLTQVILLAVDQNLSMDFVDDESRVGTRGYHLDIGTLASEDPKSLLVPLVPEGPPLIASKEHVRLCVEHKDGIGRERCEIRLGIIVAECPDELPKCTSNLFNHSLGHCYENFRNACAMTESSS